MAVSRAVWIVARFVVDWIVLVAVASFLLMILGPDPEDDGAASWLAGFVVWVGAGVLSYLDCKRIWRQQKKNVEIRRGPDDKEVPRGTKEPSTGSHRAAMIAVSCLVLLLSAAFALREYTWRADRLFVTHMELSRVYFLYVRDHGGRLPDSFEDLVGDAYLTPTEEPGVYSSPVAEGPQVLPVYTGRQPVGAYEFEYGGDIRDFEVRGERVYRPGTDKEVIFVRYGERGLDGLWNRQAVSDGRRTSVTIVREAMASLNQGGGNGRGREEGGESASNSEQ